MATVGRNVAVNSQKIHDIIHNIITKNFGGYFFEFCKVNKLPYQTILNVVNGRTKSMRAETLIMLAGALECSVCELIIRLPKRKEIKINNNVDDLGHMIDKCFS